MGDALDGEHRKGVDLVVVTGVVAVGAFRCGLARVDVPLENDLGIGRHLQVRADRLDQLGARAAQQAGEGILGKGVGHRCDRAENGRRICAQGHGHGIGPIRILLTPLAVVQRAATMAEPAHDHLIAADHLLAVDAEVLPLLVRPAGDGQAPGDQRRGVPRPTVLHRNSPEVDVIALEHDLLTGRILEHLGRHADDLLVDRQLAPGILQALGRLRLLEESQQLADLAQLGDILGTHAQRHAPRRAEQVTEHRHVEAGRLLEQQRRPLLAQGAVADLGHLQHRRHGRGDALELAALFQATDEFAQITVLHA